MIAFKIFFDFLIIMYNNILWVYEDIETSYAKVNHKLIQNK